MKKIELACSWNRRGSEKVEVKEKKCGNSDHRINESWTFEAMLKGII